VQVKNLAHKISAARVSAITEGGPSGGVGTVQSRRHEIRELIGYGDKRLVDAGATSKLSAERDFDRIGKVLSKIATALSQTSCVAIAGIEARTAAKMGHPRPSPPSCLPLIRLSPEKAENRWHGTNRGHGGKIIFVRLS
jgi:hypothetical protein